MTQLGLFPAPPAPRHVDPCVGCVHARPAACAAEPAKPERTVAHWLAGVVGECENRRNKP